MADLAQQLRYIESTLANRVQTSNDDLLNHLMSQCPDVDPLVIRALVLNEPAKDAVDARHVPDWSSYNEPSPEDPDAPSLVPPTAN